MQGVEPKKHKDMVKIVERFEELTLLFDTTVPEDHQDIIRKNAMELKAAHDFYLILIDEIERCIITYNGHHEALQKMMYPYVRKMNTKYRNNRLKK